MSDLVSKDDRDLLRSILVIDDERIEDEINGLEPEEVFSLAYEGGGMRIARFTTPEGKQYFRSSGGDMHIDDDGNESWPEWSDGPYASLNGALIEHGLGTNLLCLKPSFIHPDHRDEVRTHVEHLFGQVTTEDRKRMGEYLPKDAEKWFSRLR